MLGGFAKCFFMFSGLRNLSRSQPSGPKRLSALAHLDLHSNKMNAPRWGLEKTQRSLLCMFRPAPAAAGGGLLKHPRLGQMLTVQEVSKGSQTIMSLFLLQGSCVDHHVPRPESLFQPENLKAANLAAFGLESCLGFYHRLVWHPLNRKP